MRQSFISCTIKRLSLTLLLIPFIFSFFLITFSCNNDDESSTEKIAEIAGNWTATKATFNGTEVVSEGGVVTLNIQNNGSFIFTIKRPGHSDMVFTGKLGFDEQWLEVEYNANPGEYEYYDITYDANNLHIGANSEFDFNEDGADEIVIFFLDMVR